ncbi:uridylate kinase [Methylobacterium platani]|uniref:Uridylate kinase n=2 Tax=Methylobacterium platani TaxID=427683 RepID=A0A179SF93_9HYPH|nr:uridylate kinase [Methylobacterium platani]KMO15587.1 uridylate kinase [Methylobacterium platani JCM 14648]OAS25543.1 uridylate kinase [Methylobacterium platani]
MSHALNVVKVGGSLVADRDRLGRLLGALVDGCDGPVVVVPGGGGLADAVRTAQGALGFPDPLAHRLALDAMAGMARIFAALEPRLSVTEAPADALAAGAVPVWDPSALKAGRPEIPETWDVTSDSLALWLATRLGAATCLLVKSADPRPGAGPAELARAGLADAAFPVFAARFPGRIVLRGPGGDRLCREAVAECAA